MLNFGLIGGGAAYVPPIFQGDFIWYTYDPTDGFFVDTDTGYNMVDDKGNTVVVGHDPHVYGNKNGHMNSGHTVTVSGDGVIPVPINFDGSDVFGSVTVFDGATNTFIQEINLPLSTEYNLTDGTYGTIIKLHTNSFTQADLDVFNADPTKVIDWYNGIISLPSGIVRGADDKVYAGCESDGELLLELSYSEEATIYEDLIDPFDYYTLTPISDGYNIVSDGTGSSTQGLDFNVSRTASCSELLIIKGDFKLNSGDVKIKGYYGGPCDNINAHIFDKEVVGNRFVLFVYGRDSDFVSSYMDATTVWDADFTNIEVKSITSEYLQIQGTYTRNSKQPYGIQTMRLNMNEARVPLSVIKSKLVRFNGTGDTIDTGVAVDGSQADFTMMMAFTLPETDTTQYIAWGQTSENKLQLSHTVGEPLNTLEVGIGRYTSSITFDETNPVHAMCAMFDATTSQLQVAIDGDPLSAPFDIVFDGATSNVLFGAESLTGTDPFTGFIGEGILSGVKGEETDWQNFWNRVKDTPVPLPMPDWYKIASLDASDILGVWDMTWKGHIDTASSLVKFAGSMPNMRIDSGSPTWQGADSGLYFGGAGSIISDLPDGIDARNLTVIMEFHDARQKGTLDAFYSHYIDAQRYCLQNGWGSNKLRWSTGDGTSTTIEEATATAAGVVCTSGRDLYLDGTLLGTVPDSGASSTSNYGFRVGCIWVSSGRTQYSIFKLKKLMIVNRVLTEAEVQELTSNMTASGSSDYNPYDDLDGDGNPDTVLLQAGDLTVTEDSDSYNIDIDGDGSIDIEIPKG